MLTALSIRDLVIIEALELPLAAGLTVLTGETGAGKSILLDALGLALGERAEVTASFELADAPEAAAWLEERELAADGECHLRRVLGADGRSRAWINGRPMPVAALAEVGDLLLDIHGQHAHQRLLKPGEQRRLLDEHGGHDTALVALGTHFRHWRALDDELDQLHTHLRERGERVDLLRHQLGELDALAFTADEWAQLEQAHTRSANAERLITACTRALDLLSEQEDGAAETLVHHAQAELAPLTAIEPALVAACEALDGALIQMREAADTLRRYRDHCDADPAELARIEQRLGAIHDLARKHRVRAEELPGLHTRIAAQLAELDGADVRIETLEHERDAARNAYHDAAGALSKARHAVARTLGDRISGMMAELGMASGCFEVSIETLPEARAAAHGLDQIEFQVSANAGQPPRPLGKVASGGELSRISLAIQVAAARSAHIPTLIFDEVDSGIGGATAEVVGRLLRAVAGDRQVLCVTHLAQVAGCAHQHLRVEKRSLRDTTQAHVEVLDAERTVEELARMIGGVKISAEARAHARELRARAQGAGKKSAFPRRAAPKSLC
jgi:DNA repair protein RecN (Recombination protein N)